MTRGIKTSTHPGEILREEVIKANGLSIVKAAALLKVNPPALSNITNGKAAISPNMAIRIAKVFGGNAELWMRLQTTYDLREAEREFNEKPIELHRYEFA